jgi:hypothetical protein
MKKLGTAKVKTGTVFCCPQQRRQDPHFSRLTRAFLLHFTAYRNIPKTYVRTSHGGHFPTKKAIKGHRYFAGGKPPSSALLRISLASIIRKQNQIRRSLSRERFSERRTPSDSFEESLRQDAANFKFRSTESNFFVVFSLKDVVSGNPVSSPGRPADAA